MSDGPHKSLPMRRHWRDLAERAAKAAYSAHEVCEALPHALQKDLREAPLTAIRDILSGGQGSLFTHDEVERLEAVRQASTRSAASNVVIDCAIQAVSDGLTGDAAYRAALESACEERVRSGFRSVEEHYHREANVHSARYVRDRLDAACKQCDFKTIASGFMSAGKPPHGAVRLPRHTGLDDGPNL
ncbi:hypothetical protein ABFT80_15725 [Mesorhizobium sp. SB112]|uniref:hypothetical protein n=1 Tax=Mesorhizobium sp. SB112 TaxID=3151853 RepID=UPI0032646348